jgi:hypothetical protein
LAGKLIPGITIVPVITELFATGILSAVAGNLQKRQKMAIARILSGIKEAGAGRFMSINQIFNEVKISLPSLPEILQLD